MTSVASELGEAGPNTSWLLWAPYHAYLTRLHRELAQAGYPDIRPAHGGHVLRHLRAEGSRLTELAERAQLTKQSLGYLVDYLEARGYVERVPDPTDSRAKLIRLTAQGWALTQTAEEIIVRLEAESARRLGADRWRQLRRLLQDYAAVLEP
jgi:DNA-binding MarR family transcriptional regulator